MLLLRSDRSLSKLNTSVQHTLLVWAQRHWS
jgi:hypothetical protein